MCCRYKRVGDKSQVVIDKYLAFKKPSFQLNGYLYFAGEEVLH